MLKPLLSSTGGEHQRLLSTYCGLLARLHSIDWRILVDDPATYPAGDSLHIVSHYLTTHQTEAAGDMPRGFQSSWQWILSHGEGIVSPGLVIVHNDFHANNIIIRNGANSTGESAVVVDWTNATIADYRFDLAWSLPLLYRYADGSLRSSILREYERQSGRRVENIEFFEAVACYARLWRIYALMTEGAAESGLRPGVEETIRGQLPLIRQIYSRYCELTGLTIPEVEKFLK